MSARVAEIQFPWFASDFPASLLQWLWPLSAASTDIECKLHMRHETYESNLK